MKTLIDLGPTYADARGSIEMILESTDFASVSRIDSHAGSTRASHWHKQDSHYCIVTRGRIEYYERPVGSSDKPRLTVVYPNELFYTPPNSEHTMFFPIDTEFWCFSTLSRKNADYESDTTRLNYSLRDIYDGK